MKQNKWTIFISLPLTAVALPGAWWLDCWELTFWSNVLLGVFGSGLLTFVVAAINYCTERRKALETFWELCHKAARALNKYPVNEKKFEEKIEAILLINEFDFDALGNAYAAIDFLFGNKKARTKIYSEIYKPVRDAGRTITDSAYNIVRLRHVCPGKPQFLERYVSAVDDLLVSSETRSFENIDGKAIEFTISSNRITTLCKDHLNGFYWKIMYPLKKYEEEESE